MTSELLPAADRIDVPWNNGAGVTAQIVTEPEGAGTEGFDWRLSVATIDGAAAFSRFAGVDRSMVLLDGPAPGLDIDGRSERVSDDEVLSFAGESAAVVRHVAAPARVVNIMCRRDRVLAAVTIVPVRRRHRIRSAADDTVAIVQAGEFSATGSVLTVPDALRMRSEDRATFVGHGVLILVELSMRA